MQRNLSRPTLPISLKRKRLYRIIIRSTFCALLLVIFIFVIIVWGNKIFPTTQQNNSGYMFLKITFYILFLSVPFIITGVPLKLIDKSWSGTITSIKIKEKLGTTDNPKYVYTFPMQNLILTIKDDGCGMDKNTLNNLFVPYYSSKNNGRKN